MIKINNEAVQNGSFFDSKMLKDYTLDEIR